MPLIETQMRFRELGRIRIGQQVAGGNGRARPDKLEHFRFTSASQPLIEAVRDLFGGEVRPWTSPAGAQWEVVTTSDTLPVVLLPEMALTQWMELWKGGGCERRCDGVVETLTDQPCICPADPSERREAAKVGGACKPTTRLSVMVRGLPDVGIWRLEVHGWYAATELMGSLHLARLSGAGVVEGRLRLEQREKKVPGKPTMKYGVPVLELPGMSVDALLGSSATGHVGPGVAQQVPSVVNRRERVARPALPAGPEPPADTAFTHGGTGGVPASAPVPPPPLPPTSTNVTDDGEIIDAEVVEAPPFIARLQAAANANRGQSSVASQAHKKEVHDLLSGLGTDVVLSVLADAFALEAFADITTGEAHAVMEVAASMGRDAFRAAWAEIAA